MITGLRNVKREGLALSANLGEENTAGSGSKFQSTMFVLTMCAKTLAEAFGVRVLVGLLKSTWYIPNFSLQTQKRKISLWVGG